MGIALAEQTPARVGRARNLALSGVPALLPLCLAAVSVALLADSLSNVDLHRVTGIGLISVLPVQALVALALFTSAFMIAVYSARPIAPLAVLLLIGWICILNGMSALLVPEPPFSVAWRHAGITDYILRNGSVDPAIDAYFSWPGFFGLSALLTKVAALPSPVSLIRWAPVFFNLLYLAPLVFVFKAATDDARTVWLAAWLFYTTNWIGQDYFSPQALAYFTYLLIMGILLTWFFNGSARLWPPKDWVTGLRRTGSPAPPTLPEFALSQGGHSVQRLLAMSSLILVFGATVPSHQLTPFAIVGGVGLLVATNQVTLRGLPTLMAVLLGAWLSYMTATFLAGHLDLAFGPVGVKESAAVNVKGRLRGSPDHLTVLHGRLAFTAGVWFLAFCGAVRTRRQFRRWSAIAMLTIAPFPLMLLQAYGGEMLMRVYLLSLPFCALFLAGLLTPSASGRTSAALRATLAGALSLVLMLGFLLIRYGNQIMDQFDPAEVEAVEELYRMAPPGSLLLAGEGNLPWKHRDYERYEYKTMENYNLPFGDEERLTASLAKVLAGEDSPGGFLIITRAQKEAVELFRTPVPTGRPSGENRLDGRWLSDLEATLEDSAKFDLVYANEAASIFTLADDLRLAAR